MEELDVAIAAFHPEQALFRQLIASLAEAPRKPRRLNLLIQDNGGDETGREAIAAMAQHPAFARVEVTASRANLGFGRGINAALERGTAPWALVLNQDCVLEPGALDAL